MQYLINVIDYRTESGTTEKAVAIDAFNEKLVAGGHWVFAAGLADPTASTVIDIAAKRRSSPTTRSSRRRNGLLGSGSSGPLISTWPSR